MNENKEAVEKINPQDNDVGIAALIFGITSLFFLAPLFVPLTLLCGIIAILKKQLVLGVGGIICGVIGLVKSPMLFGTFWLAITGTNIDNKINSMLDNINCKLVEMDISTRQPCSHPIATAQNPNPIPIAQTQLVPAFISLFQEYSTKAEKKAIALAQDSHRRAAWGYSFNYATQTQANERALLECRNYLAKYRVETDCKLYAIGNQVVWESGSNK
jgi:hypothetical protein